MKKFREFIPHLALSMLFGLLLITYLDGRNPLMKFLTSTASKVYIIILVAVCTATAICLIADNMKR